MFGKRHSKKSKEKISKSRKGKYTGKNNGFYGKHHSDKVKNKWSKIRKGIPSKRKRPVKQIDVNTNGVIKIWPSCKEAAIGMCGKSYGGVISAVCNKYKSKEGWINKSAFGFKWEYL